jgi:hypothetical protein
MLRTARFGVPEMLCPLNIHFAPSPLRGEGGQLLSLKKAARCDSKPPQLRCARYPHREECSTLSPTLSPQGRGSRCRKFTGMGFPGSASEVRNISWLSWQYCSSTEQQRSVSPAACQAAAEGKEGFAATLCAIRESHLPALRHLPLRGFGLPRHGFSACCLHAFTGAPGATMVAIAAVSRPSSLLHPVEFT